MDAAMGKVNMCAARKGDTMRVAPTPLPEIPAEMRAILEGTKEKVG